MKFSSMKNTFSGLLNICENSCNKKILTKFAGGVKLKKDGKLQRDNDENCTSNH